MKLIIYVHDFSRQIGHSRAMIEVIDQLKPKSVKVVCYSHSSVKEINEKVPIPYTFIKVPCGWLKPFLLRNIFFQLYTTIFESLWKSPEEISISIGVCSFNGDIINIQFAHFLWEKLYFKASPVSWYKGLYERVLLKYLTICEDLCYRKENLKFVFLSSFIEKAIVDRYKIPPQNYVTAYSSANSEHFSPSNRSRKEKYNLLIEKHPELASINRDRPSLLFIGAFERKGLPLFIDHIPDTYNLIIVGQPETGSQFKVPNKENFYHIPFSKNINLFYEVCDHFIFPTIYEPFGLVLLEAALSGMKIITALERVGASELLIDLPGVTFCDPFKMNKEVFKNLEILSDEERQELSTIRKNKLSHTTWKTCANQWLKILNT